MNKQRPSERLAAVNQEWDALIAKSEAGNLEPGDRLRMDLLEEEAMQARAEARSEQIKARLKAQHQEA